MSDAETSVDPDGSAVGQHRGRSGSSTRLSRLPGYRRLTPIPRQLAHPNPFFFGWRPSRVPLLAFHSGRTALPFPRPWNYRQPLRILETYFWGADEEQGSGRHNRYLDAPGFAPVRETRDPEIVRATATGDKPGQFDRDRLPSIGIARATGVDTLLHVIWPTWRRNRRTARWSISRGETTDKSHAVFHA